MSRMRASLCGLICLLVPALGLAQEPRPATPAGGEFEWRFKVRPDQVVSSEITAENTCNKRHRFEIVDQGLPAFMRLRGESGADVNSHAKHDFPVAFDASGLAPGEYQGRVVVKCVNCGAEKGCTQDRDVLHIYMTVEAQRAADFVPGRVVVMIPFDSAAGVEATAKQLGAEHGLKVEEVSRLDSLQAALVVYALPAGTDVLSTIAELEPDVLLAQPDFLYSTFAPATQAANTPPALAYGPRLIGADRLRGTVTGKGVRVALIDTGLDAGHPALQGKIVEQADMTGKGFSADVHATLLAGIIAADSKSGNGISGIAPGVEIVAIKACQPQSAQTIQAQCWSITLAKGLDFAIEKKAAVINMSLGGPGGVEDKLLKRMVDEAVGRGIVVVAAAGNDGPKSLPGFPAALPNVVAVTAVDSKEQLYAYATQGDFIALAAPGVEILSTSPGGKALVSSGTSLAAAFVSGTAALVLQQQPKLSPRSLQALLERTAKDLGPPGKDPQFGAGLVDACRAVAELKGDGKLCR